jgi:DNA-binding protein HU-beta
MKKTELIEVMAQKADISKAAAERALEGAIEAIEKTLKNGENVTLVGFGSFYLSERKARSGINPRTKEPLNIAAARVPRFRAGKALKEAVK